MLNPGLKDTISALTDGTQKTSVINVAGATINPATLEMQNKHYDSLLASWETNKGHTGAQMMISYSEAIMHGAIPGASIFSSNGHYVTTGAVTDTPLITGGVVNIAPAGGVQLTIVSTSAQDTNLTGTGVWTLAIGYIEDTTLAAKTEIVAMNGLTPVTTVATNIRFVNTMTRITAGGASVPIGTITAKNGATLYGQMDPGHKILASSFRMIPAGKTFYPKLIVASSNSGTAAAQTVFHIVQWSPTLQFFTPSNAAGCQDGSVIIDIGEVGRGITAGSVLGMEFSSNRATEVTASFIGYIENS